MGREVGWLTLGAGIAAGADVILIPEIPYNIEQYLKGHPRQEQGRKDVQHCGRGGRGNIIRAGGVFRAVPEIKPADP